MTLEQRSKEFETFTEEQKKILCKKAHDYANADVLSSFKLSANTVGVTPSLGCLYHIATKVTRLGNLLGSGATPKNESVADSVLDLANYAFLLHCLLKEQEL